MIAQNQRNAAVGRGDGTPTRTWARRVAGAWDGYVFNAETKQYHVRFRCYDPVLGRWLERDPLEYEDGMSLYEYVASNPSTNIDSTGAANSRPPGYPFDECFWGDQRNRRYVKKCGRGNDRWFRVCQRREVCRLRASEQRMVWTHNPGDPERCGDCFFDARTITLPPPLPPPPPLANERKHPCQRYRDCPNLANCIDCCNFFCGKLPGFPPIPPIKIIPPIPAPSIPTAEDPCWWCYKGCPP